MIVEIIVDVTSTNNNAQIANALTPIEAGLRQLGLDPDGSGNGTTCPQQLQQLVQQLNHYRINATQNWLVMIIVMTSIAK